MAALRKANRLGRGAGGEEEEVRPLVAEVSRLVTDGRPPLWAGVGTGSVLSLIQS